VHAAPAINIPRNNHMGTLFFFAKNPNTPEMADAKINERVKKIKP
jgi:hypothetical protein